MFLRISNFHKNSKKEVDLLSASCLFIHHLYGQKKCLPNKNQLKKFCHKKFRPKNLVLQIFYKKMLVKKMLLKN